VQERLVAIEVDVGPADLDGAHTEPVFPLVGQPIAVEQGRADAVEVRVVGRPQLGFRHRDLDGRPCGSRLERDLLLGSAGAVAVGVEHLDQQVAPGSRTHVGQLDLDTGDGTVDIRLHEGVVYTTCLARLEPDVMPDPAPVHEHVVDDVDAARERIDLPILSTIDLYDDQSSPAGAHLIGHIDLERRHVSEVATHVLAIDPYLGGAVHGADMQDGAPTRELARDDHQAAIPGLAHVVVIDLVGGRAEALGIP